MKLVALSAAIAASAIAMPAAAQGYGPAWLHNDYVQLTGGDIFQGRTFAHVDVGGTPGSSSDSLKDDVFGSLEYGHRLAPGLAIEVEGVYARTHEDGAGLAVPLTTYNVSTFKTYGGLANLKLSVPQVDRYMPFGVTPYIAGGAGYGDVEYGGVNSSGGGFNADRAGFMWQGKAGLEVKMNPRLTWDIGYRYLEAPELDASGNLSGVAGSIKARSNIQAATLGLRLNF